jgi:hypothetical protein
MLTYQDSVPGPLTRYAEDGGSSGGVAGVADVTL